MTAGRRRPIVAGNWKMNTTLPEARDLARALRPLLSGLAGVEVAVCPPFISLAAVGEALRGSPIALGAQNCHYEARGAFTGEISPLMLADLGCRYVILGHSERRTYFGESDELVARKVAAVLGHGLTPIVCVGERLEQREAGQTEQVVGSQVRAALAGLASEQIAGLVIAYEPVWAIGTGRAASAEDANETIGFIRRTIGDLAGAAAVAAVRIQYGGSVTPANAPALFAQPEIDGALVGGASLAAADFSAICRAAAAR
jgi:triosephosphate isomerase